MMLRRASTALREGFVSQTSEEQSGRLLTVGLQRPKNRSMHGWLGRSQDAELKIFLRFEKS